MLKIATHNSGTGEKGLTFFHDLFSIFSKCQDKTILEQWNEGVRFFDLRISKSLYLAHGLWRSKISLEEVLDTLNEVSKNDSVNPTHIMITIENNYDERIINRLVLYLRILKDKYTNLVFVSINRKRPIWKTIVFYNQIKCASDYVSVPWITEWKKITLKNWKRYIPIPRILNKYYTRNHKFNNGYYVMVDFY